MNMLVELASDPIVLGIWTVLALIACLASFKLVAPYGRHTREGWGTMISNKIGWFIMELPALIIVPYLYLFSNTSSKTHAILCVLWLVHYIHRTLLFPWITRTSKKLIPLSVVLMAFAFNSINGFVVGTVFYESPNTNIWSLSLGIILFTLGAGINLVADYQLIQLRKDSSNQYSIPYGRLFSRISCPNHFGEMMEWLGFALAAWHIGPLVFAFWTFANLIPRSWAHHRWYRHNFEDYPEDRKAVIPFIL